MTETPLTAQTCPYCGGIRTPKDAGPGYVTWLCHDCARVGREVSDD